MRMLRGIVVGGLLIGSLAHAEPVTTTVVVPSTDDVILGAPKIIYLNRCIGGCTVTGGDHNDARTQTSLIPDAGPHAISEFQGTDWPEIVDCLTDVFSPYDVTLTEVEPPPTEHYGEAIIAGSPVEIGVSPAFGGIAPIDEFCRPLDYPISFTFANVYTEDRINLICATASQEIAHTYGLDHAFAFFDGSSSCSDPMTYRFDCGGQKFFRNHVAQCGEYEARGCRCAPNQNSHALMSGVLGAGIPTTTTAVSITDPVDGATIANQQTIVAPAFAQRGLTDVVFLLNGYPWSKQPGAPFGANGQELTDYQFTLPETVPDGVIEIDVEVRDDLAATSVARVTVTKGAPCASADTCLAGQYCDAGRCSWGPPTGEIGDACDYPQFCLDERCDTHDGESYCTRTCIAGIENSCPSGLECIATSATEGYCWPPAGGCCSASRERSWHAILLGALTLVLLRRRR
jgi:hypothetical protein